MRFAEPQMGYLFWGVVFFICFFSWAYRRKKEKKSIFVETHLWQDIVTICHRKDIFKKILLIGVFIFSILALMRPQWGFEWREVKRQGLDIIVAIDTSKSMLTEDVRPSRLERSKLAVKDLVKKLTGDRIGLVAFSGTAFLVCPLTVDYSGFMISLEDVDSSTIPEGGTNVGRAILEAIQGYENVPSKYKAVIIITDGENLQGDPLKAAQEAKEKNIKIFCVGIGTKKGELIRYRNAQGRYEFVKDNQGNFVKSRLNEELLKQIALRTGGVYVRAAGAEFGFDVIYDRLSKMEKREIKSRMEKRFYERFQVPLTLALLLLILETVITTRKKP